MIVTKNLKLYLGSPAELQRPVYVSQGDTGWAFVCTIYSGTTVWEIPAGTTATINGCKPDGTAFSYSCEISGSTVTAPCEEQMTVIPGDVKCELKFAQGGRIIATANFRLVVECSPTGEHRPSETELNALDQAIDEVQTIAGQVRAAYGAPRTAASAAEMTDPTLIYVYTGTTGGGYVFGDWYYYDGSAWVNGGTYNSMALELDDTFTSETEPPSAKATGDRIGDLQTAVTAIEEKTGYTKAIASDAGTALNFVINSANQWYAQASYKSRVIALPEDISAINLRNSNAIGAFYAFLRSFSAPVTVGAAADGYGRVSVAAGETVAPKIPADAKYIYATLSNATGDSTSLDIEISTNSIFASKNELETLQIEVEQKIGYKYQIDAASGTITSYIINSANQWYTQNDYPARSGVLELPEDIDDVVLDNQTEYGCYYAFLRSFTLPLVVGEPVDGYPRTFLEAGASTKIQVPTDASYLYVVLISTSGNATKPNVELIKNPAYATLTDVFNDGPKFAHYKGTDSSKEFGFVSTKRGNRVQLAYNFSVFGTVRLGYKNAADADADYIELTSTDITIVNNANTVSSETHGLTLVNEVYVDIYNDFTKLYISVSAADEIFEKTINYEARYRKPFYNIVNGTFSEVDFSFTNDDLNNDIWLFGDSYMSNSPSFWVYYLVGNELSKNCLINAYAGCPTERAIINFDNLIALSRPKYIVWALGMNDGNDSTSSPSSAWLAGVSHIKTVCANKNIRIVLCTIPTVPTVRNEKKNEYVRNSGLPYIDFAKAVGADSSGTWYPGTMGPDGVHPNSAGAKLLYRRALTDFPIFFLKH